MSVFVRGLEMPKNCALCIFRAPGETWCPFTLQEVPGNTIPEDCPLTPVPPHGRLIDADALEKEHMKRAYENFRSYQFHVSATAWINEATTIIPAEEETT